METKKKKKTKIQIVQIHSKCRRSYTTKIILAYGCQLMRISIIINYTSNKKWKKKWDSEADIYNIRMQTDRQTEVKLFPTSL